MFYCFTKYKTIYKTRRLWLAYYCSLQDMVDLHHWCSMTDETYANKNFVRIALSVIYLMEGLEEWKAISESTLGSGYYA